MQLRRAPPLAHCTQRRYANVLTKKHFRRCTKPHYLACQSEFLAFLLDNYKRRGLLFRRSGYVDVFTETCHFLGDGREAKTGLQGAAMGAAGRETRTREGRSGAAT